MLDDRLRPSFPVWFKAVWLDVRSKPKSDAQVWCSDEMQSSGQLKARHCNAWDWITCRAAYNMRSFESQSAWQYILVYISGTMSVILVLNQQRIWIVWHMCVMLICLVRSSKSRTMRTRTRIISYACFSYISDVSTRNISIRVGLFVWVPWSCRYVRSVSESVWRAVWER